MATVLFGPELKLTEYNMRKKSIIENENLYGEEKLEKLNKLKKDMWGAEANDIVDYSSPSSRYNATVELYRKNLDEMSEKEREAELEEYRNKYFSSGVKNNYNKYYEKLQSQLKEGKQ